MPDFPENIPDHVRESMTITLSTMALEAEKVQLTLQQLVGQARAAGMDLADIERMLIEDLRTGGQLFGDFRANFKSQMRYSLEEIARGEVYEKHKDVKNFIWVAVGDDKLCPDCDKRNGKVMTLDEWRKIGLPGAGATICQRNCRCGLAPDGSISVPPGGIMRKNS